MQDTLTISLGQYSDKGKKESNQDFHGVFIPETKLLTTKGIAIALADGISSSPVSHVASESAVKSFLEDYFCTSESWTVMKAARSVLFATNSWLFSQTRASQYRYEKDRGYICTFSALILKSHTAHLFHVGDARIYRVQQSSLEQLTQDHRMWVSQEEHYLARALGMDSHLEVDYHTVPVATGDMFMLCTDGVYEFVQAEEVAGIIARSIDDLELAAKQIVEAAYNAGSGDNLTVQLVRVDGLPQRGVGEVQQKLQDLPLPPQLEEGMSLDGYKIMRKLHASSRSHVFLAYDKLNDATVVLKAPSVDLSEDPDYLERFLLEDWVAQRINSQYVLRPVANEQAHSALYLVSEYIEGRTLRQWMIDNPAPDLAIVRDIVDQIARGLMAFHRLEMLHQDLRPENIMIDTNGSVKIIDLGSVRIEGVEETFVNGDQSKLLGTPQYTAPEYFLGESCSTQSDLFSLGVITYELLSGRLPYGAEVAKTRTRMQQNKLHYRSVLDEKSEIPAWLDMTLRTAVQPNPVKRYTQLSEFMHDLRNPSRQFINQEKLPLMERSPVAFWQGLSLILVLIILALLVQLAP